jgi:hypothetical protein
MVRTAGGAQRQALRSFRPNEAHSTSPKNLLFAIALAAMLAGGRLTTSGTAFVQADGKPFAWRGLTAFRLVEFVAHGRTGDADAYLAWAASKHATVVRVLAMADVLFSLSPADGQHALGQTLDLARKRGVYVEVVALADTARLRVDVPRAVRAIGSVCAAYDNCLLEIANEPGHPTQLADLHDAAYVKSLVPLVPKGVPVSLGSVEYGDGFAAGSYVTWHAPRTRPVAALDAGARLLARFKKPVVSDEPIGAAETRVPGRRESDPDVFRHMARTSKQLGLGATFHYEGGLQARIPVGRELACFEAWMGEMLRD